MYIYECVVTLKKEAVAFKKILKGYLINLSLYSDLNSNNSK